MMMLNEIFIWVTIIGFVSVILNIFLLVYIRRWLLRIFSASELASEIFTRLDSFEEHLNSVHEMPTFYGDETLKGLIEHAKSLTEYLGQYEEVYSFTQPDLMEQLETASRELQEKYDQEDTAQEEK